MLAIIGHHFIVHGLDLPNTFGIAINSQSIILSFLIIGVSCFILISGYFSIKFNLVSLFSLYTICVFYAVVQYLVGCYTGFYNFEIKQLLYQFMPFSHSIWWFVTAYICLYLLSPLLNKAIENMNKNQYLFVLILLSVVNVYLGFLWQGDVNSNGSNVMHFIFLYMIARFLAIYNIGTKTSTYKLFAFYIASVAAIFCGVLICIYFGRSYDFAFAYNNPFVILSSILALLMFAKLKFTSKFVNYIASSVFAVYLIHDNIFIRSTLAGFINNLSNIDYFPLIVVCTVFVVFVACIIIDKIRQILLSPLERFLHPTLIAWQNKITKKIRDN